VLRNIPSNTGGSFGESFANSFASGAAGISLRGLGQKTTLVLLNGRRTAGYGFAQNLQDSFVDLNSIPSSAVERIEILKDGASAIYGSDAIAGVVNVILRKDYKGFEVAGQVGRSEGKNDYRFNLTAARATSRATAGRSSAPSTTTSASTCCWPRPTSARRATTASIRAGATSTRSPAAGTWTPLTRPARSAPPNAARSASARPTAATVTRGPGRGAGLLASTSALVNATNTWCGLDTNSTSRRCPGPSAPAS
jgi:iron complex outermembrane receptor protein